jgi:chromosome segregation ATPase
LILCLLPTVLLGITYFFLVEYILREHAGLMQIPPLLRYGGGALILLFTFAALASAIHLSDRIRRPLRALTKIAEGTPPPPGQTTYLPDSDPELRFLFLRVQTLVQQNRSGAQSLSELESLRQEVEELSTDFRRANERLRVPTLVTDDGEASRGRLTEEIHRFWERLRADLVEVEEKLSSLVETLTREESAWASSSGEAEGALRDVERVGTVWSLEMEIARRELPHMRGSLGSNFEEFKAATERLRKASQSNGGAVAAVSGLRSDVAALRDTITKWLQSEQQGQHEDGSAPMRGEE